MEAGLIQIQDLCIKCKTRRLIFLSLSEPLQLLQSHSRSHMVNGSGATGAAMEKITSLSEFWDTGEPSISSLHSRLLIGKYLARQAYWYLCCQTTQNQTFKFKLNTDHLRYSLRDRLLCYRSPSSGLKARMKPGSYSMLVVLHMATLQYCDLMVSLIMIDLIHCRFKVLSAN